MKSKRIKVLYNIEHSIRCPPHILFEFLSTSGGLQEWYADKVIQRDHYFSFFWDDSEEHTLIEESEIDKFIKFRRLQQDGTPTDEYFSFKIEQTEISNQTIFTISDFAYQNDIEDQKRLWEHQVHSLFYRLGIH